MNILHGLTGSVATVIANKFDSYVDNVKFILTDSSKNFQPYFQTMRHSQQDVPEYLKFGYFGDEHEWDIYKKEKKVLHIELIKWADVFVIAPCSANTLAKLVNGICDNLLTCCARAWNFDKQFIVAPSMNTRMWTHPITQEHITKLKSWGIEIVDPIEKELYCGDIGIGAMANISDITDCIKQVPKL